MIKTNRVKLKLNKAQFELVREKQIECKYDIQKIVKDS